MFNASVWMGHINVIVAFSWYLFVHSVYLCSFYLFVSFYFMPGQCFKVFGPWLLWKCHPDLHNDINNNFDIPLTFEPACIKRPLYDCIPFLDVLQLFLRKSEGPWKPDVPRSDFYNKGKCRSYKPSKTYLRRFPCTSLLEQKLQVRFGRLVQKFSNNISCRNRKHLNISLISINV